MAGPRPVEAATAARAADIPFAAILDGQRPLVFRGLAADWPLVREGRKSPQAAVDYLKRWDSGHPVTGYTGPPEIGGRFFYADADLTRLNFRAEQVGFGAFLDRMAAGLDDPGGPALYIGSTDLDIYLPGFRGENDLGLGAEVLGAEPLASIWIGGRTVAAAHYDMSNNVAVCAAGRRRFTLFPPEQVENLYPGPLEPTPGGQVVSLVDLRDPDFDRFPKAREALAAAQVAELEPGDVLVYPALWWHQVEALEPFNVLVNYWWNDAPAFLDTPQTTLLHGLLSLRDRPEHEKAAWKALFDFYVFGSADRAAAHLPEAGQGPLGPLTDIKARRLRAQLLNRLNR